MSRSVLCLHFGIHKQDVALRGGGKAPVQLYDTVADIGETTDLASKHPEIVKRLQAIYDAQVEEVKANQRPTAEMARPPNALSPAQGTDESASGLIQFPAKRENFR